MKLASRFAFVFAAFCSCQSLVGQSALDQIGFTELQARLGAAIPDGSSINTAQIEAPVVRTDAFFPITTNDQFSGTTFINGTDPVIPNSDHATNVGVRFFGSRSSQTPGIDNITVYGASDFIARLGNGSSNPEAFGFDVTNHSYIAEVAATNSTPANDRAANEQTLQRFDFVNDRDNTIAVVGTDNGSRSVTPSLFAPSYNSITVGRTDGLHSQTTTDLVSGDARFAVELVAPESSTSFATPHVSSSAALLLEAGAGTNFTQNEAVRAALFAGATKDEFAAWDRTTTRPIDERFGFGELNVNNSYAIFEGGEVNASANPSTDLGLNAWDYGDFDGGDLFYDFTVGANDNLTELSAVLTWNADFTDGIPGHFEFSPQFDLSDLNLELFDANGVLIDSSLSTAYNHEHIYLNTPLGAGTYTFRLSGDSATDFGFAFRSTVVSVTPEPGSLVVLAALLTGYSTRRRRS